MDKFIEKFGLFDVFSMLIPGIFFMSFLLYLYPDIQMWAEDSYGNDVSKVFLFFVLSYFFGIIFHEIGRICDEIGKRVFKKKDIGEKFLLPKQGIIRNEVDFIMAEAVKKYILKECDFDKVNVEEEVKNRFVFNYCMNALEIEGMAGKVEKMYMIYEMSVALFLECIFLEFIYIILILCGAVPINIANIVVLLISSIIFRERKRRYARYRVDNLMRTYYIMTKRKEGYEKSQKE